ncbi:secG [Symbiodinium sp. CCMP2592]|nr:secG [Symbiodinium sp. CCMP2592]
MPLADSSIGGSPPQSHCKRLGGSPPAPHFSPCRHEVLMPPMCRRRCFYLELLSLEGQALCPRRQQLLQQWSGHLLPRSVFATSACIQSRHVWIHCCLCTAAVGTPVQATHQAHADFSVQRKGRRWLGPLPAALRLMPREKTQRDYEREARRPDKRTRAEMRARREAGEHVSAAATSTTAGPPLTLFSARRYRRPRTPPAPPRPPARTRGDSIAATISERPSQHDEEAEGTAEEAEDELVEVTIEVEEEQPSSMPSVLQPMTPPHPPPNTTSPTSPAEPLEPMTTTEAADEGLALQTEEEPTGASTQAEPMEEPDGSRVEPVAEAEHFVPMAPKPKVKARPLSPRFAPPVEPESTADTEVTHTEASRTDASSTAPSRLTSPSVPALTKIPKGSIGRLLQERAAANLRSAKSSTPTLPARRRGTAVKSQCKPKPDPSPIAATGLPPTLEVVLPTASSTMPGDVEFVQVGTLSQEEGDRASSSSRHQWFLTTPGNPEPTPVLDMPDWLHRALLKRPTSPAPPPPKRRAKSSTTAAADDQTHETTDARKPECDYMRVPDSLPGIVYPFTLYLSLCPDCNTGTTKVLPGQVLELLYGAYAQDCCALEGTGQCKQPAQPLNSVPWVCELLVPNSPSALLCESETTLQPAAPTEPDQMATRVPGTPIAALLQRVPRPRPDSEASMAPPPHAPGMIGGTPLEAFRPPDHPLPRQPSARSRDSRRNRAPTMARPSQAPHLRLTEPGPSSSAPPMQSTANTASGVEAEPPLVPSMEMLEAASDLSRVAEVPSEPTGLLWEDCLDLDLMPPPEWSLPALRPATLDPPPPGIRQGQNRGCPPGQAGPQLDHNNAELDFIADGWPRSGIQAPHVGPGVQADPSKARPQQACPTASQVATALSADASLAANACNLPQRFRGAVPHKMMGGISISLDVKKAFDSLSHEFLEAAMREADFDECEIALVLHLHTHAQLQVGTGAEAASVPLGTGVRQGCSLSPILWALATGRVYRLYTAALKEHSLPEGLTNMFADDFFRILVSTLQQAGLELSLDKTVIPAAFMDLEGVSQDELQEAAAALTMLQTMALQGRTLFDAQQSPPTGPAQNLVSSHHPPALEVPTPPRQALSFTETLTGEDQPSKFTKTQEKGQGGKGHRQGPQNRRQFPSSSRTPPAGPQPSSAPSGGSPSKIMVSTSLITQVVQLLLRHTDALNSIEQSTTWILFQGTAPPLTVVAAQATIAEEWNKLKTSNPSAITQPLRVVLWQTWASEFIKRLQLLDTDLNQRNEAIRLQILTEPNCFKYVRWDSSQKRLIPQDNLAPLTAKEIVDMLQETIVLCKEDGVLINYHPMRRLTEQMAGAAITFSMHLGLREARAYRFWTIIEAQAGSASLQLVATTIRKDRRGRSPLAQALEAELRRLQ